MKVFADDDDNFIHDHHGCPSGRSDFKKGFYIIILEKDYKTPKKLNNSHISGSIGKRQ